jgi:menaquinone-specific isochorismate synthase
VALGVLPFRPSDGTELVIPAVMVGKDADGTRWITTIEGDDAPAVGDVDLEPCPPPVAAAGGFSVEPGVPVETYLAAVTAGRDEVRAGRLTKVVIARDVLVTADRPLDVHAILLRLRAAFGSSYRYSMEGFVGASPELLVARHGDVVRSHPLAGTAPRTGDLTNDAASRPPSPRRRTRSSTGSSSTWCTRPSCSGAATSTGRRSLDRRGMQHLGTLIEGGCRRRAERARDGPGAVADAGSAGTRDAAIELIAAVEGFERGSAAAGWVDWAGNGTWAVPSVAPRSTARPRLRRRGGSWRTASRGRAGRDAAAAGHALGHHPA